MAQIKTSELTGKALDYAVAVCEGISPIIDDGRIYSRYPQGKEWDYPITYQNWSQGGPIIGREGILFCLLDGDKLGATLNIGISLIMQSAGRDEYLIAAMRCYVASKLGDVVEIPDELVSN